MCSRRPSLVFPLAALAMAMMLPLQMRQARDRRADRKITDIMNAAAIDGKAERKVVYDAAHDNNFRDLPAAEVKAARDVRAVMLDDKGHFHPKP
jgi:hypothetical protein